MELLRPRHQHNCARIKRDQDTCLDYCDRVPQQAVNAFAALGEIRYLPRSRYHDLCSGATSVNMTIACKQLSSLLFPRPVFVSCMGQSVRSVVRSTFDGFENCHSVFDCKYAEVDAPSAPVEQLGVTCCCCERFQVGLAPFSLSERHEKYEKENSV